MNIIFQIDGGLGKSIMATAVLKCIKKKYPKSYVIVVTHYTDVFVNNPCVNKLLRFDQLTAIYKNYINNQKCKVFVTDPYQTSDFILSENHLIKIWCDLYGLDYENELPEFYLNKAEIDYFEKFYKLDKPIMVIQPNGGAVNQPLKYSWTRDIPSPVIMEVISKFKNEYAILHVKRQDQISYPDTLQAIDSIRSIAVLLKMSNKRLLIDSSCMHLATALNLPSVVTWVGTSSNVFGYEMHKNIVSKPPTKEIVTEHNHYQKHLLFEDISNLPYNNLNEVFDVNQIIKSLKL